MTRVFVGLGSNEGDRKANLRRAAGALATISKTDCVRISSIYESDSIGDPGEPLYLNAVAELDTELTSEGLWSHLARIESKLGRSQRARRGPRSIDLDLLYFGSVRREQFHLNLPHPRANERLFVLVPMTELDPGWTDPRSGQRMDQLLRERKNQSAVRWVGRF